jgi:hypothetical protein
VDVSTLSGDSFHAEYCLHICADRARTSAVRRHGLPGHCPRPLHRSRLASGLAVPVTQIKFGVPWAPYPEALDIHLLRSQSTGNLHDHLYVQDAADSKWKSVVAEYTGNDIEISFVPVFKIVHDDTIPVYSNFGISVDKKTGRVSVDNTWTSDGSPHNFILEAFISDNGNGITWI